MMRPIALGAVLAVLACAPIAVAQTAPAKRTILQRTDVAASPAQETIVGTVEIAPGAGNPMHYHNGSEIGVVVAGQIRLEVEGQPPRTLGVGESFLIPRGVVHRSLPASPTGAKLISTWTLDKGGEIMIPAPAKP